MNTGEVGVGCVYCGRSPHSGPCLPPPSENPGYRRPVKPWPIGVKAAGRISMLLGGLIGLLFVAGSWAELATAHDTSIHAARQQRHDVQLRACLSAGGVPYFHDSGLFRWCQFR
jgi:hypothetical protein